MTLKNTPFSQQIGYLSRGSLDAELTEEMAALVKAVRETGKAGTITLTLKVQRLSGRDENAVQIVPTVKMKAPAPAPYTNIMFSTGDGDLLRDDPNQRTLELQQVEPQKRTFATS